MKSKTNIRTEGNSAGSVQRLVRPIQLTKREIGWLQCAIQKPGHGVFHPSEHHAKIYDQILKKLNVMFWQKKLPKNFRKMIAKINKSHREVMSQLK